ncbi:gephyrin-like molybdotransferase Glp [Candidatus Poribacteria bacterium]
MSSGDYFFKVKTPDEVRGLLREIACPLPTENVELSENILGRVLAEDIKSPVDLPGFQRAIMDGFGVRARDTFGATPSAPAYLTLAGEVRMGEAASVTVSPGEAVRVSTGSMMPEGGDAVVMVEYTDFLDDETIEIVRGVAPGDHVVGKTEDLHEGELMLPGGHVIRPQDVGALASVGITNVSVSRQPRVAIISSGDEIIPPDEPIQTGQIRDINSYSLACLAQQAGGVPMRMGIVRDDFDSLKSCLAKGLEEADIALISGGSSVGARDVTLDVIQSFDGAEVLVHGISIRPGKPTIIAKVDDKYLFGLPGNPVSVMVTFGLFVGLLIKLLNGANTPVWKQRLVRAKLNRNIASAPGREDYVSVRLVEEDGKMLAEPVLGRSALITTLVKADGLIKIPLESEGLEEGAEVAVTVFAH